MMTTESQSGMYAPQRQQELARMVNDVGRIDAAAAAEQLNVSSETIRKDLIELERGGVLRRVHGGAISVQDLTFEPTVTARTRMMEEKRRIARAAVDELPADGAVLLDNGSTTGCLAEAFPSDRDLAVFTSSLPSALSLLARPRLTVSTLGGRVRPVTHAEVGNWAIRALEELHVDVVFLGTNGLSPENGLTTPDEAEATAKRMMLRAGRRRVLLADHSKVGVVSMLQHATLEEIDLVITDRGVDEADADRLRQATDLKVV